MKKSHIRTLAIIAEGTPDGGATSDDVAILMQKCYGKTCEPSVAKALAESLVAPGLVRTSAAGTWMATPSGLSLYGTIKDSYPEKLERTSSPALPTRI